MVTVVPVRYHVNEEPDSPHSDEYFFDRAIVANRPNFNRVGVSDETIENIKKSIDTEIKGLSEKMSEIITDPQSITTLLPDTARWIERIRSAPTDLFIYNKEPRALILRNNSNSFIIISKNIDAINSLIATLSQDFQQISNITKDFGLGFEGFTTGEEYAKEILSHITPDIKSYKIGLPKNPFEQEIINHVSTITNCKLTNIEIQFEKPNENHEFDILVPLEEGAIIDIEITDYKTIKDLTHEDSDTIKSKLILGTSDKAKRLRANVVIVASGFPQVIFDQMKEFAASRNIILLNENNYKKELEEMLLRNAVNTLVRSRPSPSTRRLRWRAMEYSPIREFAE